MSDDYISVAFLSKKYEISKSRLYYLVSTDRLRFRYDNGLLVISEESFLLSLFGKVKTPTFRWQL